MTERLTRAGDVQEFVAWSPASTCAILNLSLARQARQGANLATLYRPCGASSSQAGASGSTTTEMALR